MGRSRIDRANHREYRIELRQAIAELLPAQGLPLLGKGRWTDRLLVMVMLLVVWSGLPTLQERFAEARSAVVAMYVSRRRPGNTWVGFMGKMHYRCWKAIKNARLVAICDVDPAKLKGATGPAGNISGGATVLDMTGIETYSDFGQMLKKAKLDAVDRIKRIMPDAAAQSITPLRKARHPSSR